MSDFHSHFEIWKTGSTSAVSMSATKEIMQDIALYTLWRANFFDVAVFQGGASLRILNSLPRFSENLDFMLLEPDRIFNWSTYLDTLMDMFAPFGARSEAKPKGDMDKRIRAALIKDTSIAGQLDPAFADRQPDQTIRIKLEIDVEPPAFSQEAWAFLEFPTDHEVRHQDLASNFALKIHAVLCREYLKGRDWYDFSWYVAKGVFPNLAHLQAALIQFGPWRGQKDLTVDKDWLDRALGHLIGTVDWEAAQTDVRRFLRPEELKSLDLWSTRFFDAKLKKLIASTG